MGAEEWKGDGRNDAAMGIYAAKRPPPKPDFHLPEGKTGVRKPVKMQKRGCCRPDPFKFRTLTNGRIWSMLRLKPINQRQNTLFLPLNGVFLSKFVTCHIRGGSADKKRGLCHTKKIRPFSSSKSGRGGKKNVYISTAEADGSSEKGDGGLFHYHLYGTVCHSDEVCTGNELLTILCTTDI